MHPIMETIILHNSETVYKVDSVFVFTKIKGIRNLKNVKVFCQNATFSPRMHSTVTKVILTDKGLHNKPCLSKSKMGSNKHRRYGHFKNFNICNRCS